MKEYDFRFEGLREAVTGNPENLQRVRRVRDTLLKIAGGFTELVPGVRTDMLPGQGMGYIVGISSKGKARALQAALRGLAAQWGLQPPTLQEASSGPRRDYSFFLVPERANPSRPGGYRRPLFRLSRWAKIDTVFRAIGGLRVESVYGEWLPSRSAQTPVHDDSRMYALHRASSSARRELVRFIRSHVFDRGIECDQECIYLSCGGVPALVREK